MKKYAIILLSLISLYFSEGRVGYVADIGGYVEIISDKNNDLLTLEAVEGRYLYEGDILRSYKDSYCTIIFEDQSALFSISENSEIFLNTKEDALKKIKLNYGEIYIENKSKLIPFFVFTQSTQIYSLFSSVFIRSSINKNDIIYPVFNKIEIYNKKSNLSLSLQSDNKAFSYNNGQLQLGEKEGNFIPKKLLASIQLESLNLKRPEKEFVYKKGDLVPDYSSDYNIDVYNPDGKKKKNIRLNSSLSYIKDNLYFKILINPKYKNKNIYLNLEVEHYLPASESPDIDLWDEPVKILAKIKQFNYSKDLNKFSLYTGSLKNLTIGHGLLVKNYKNHSNYPLRNSYGLQFKYTTKNFIDFEFFSSNISDLIDGEGFLGLHTSLFISKYLPLRLGLGLIADINQFANLEDEFEMSNRNIKAFEFDSTYDLYSKKGYDINLISEFAAILFSEKHYYKRYDSDNLGEGLKNKEGSWGAAAGLEGSYSQFFNLKTLIHYNEPLFLPYFFNDTYDFERYRLLQQKDVYSDVNLIDGMLASYESNGLVVIPKDLYLSYMETEFVYSSVGFSVDTYYNYYDKVLCYASYNIFTEIGNPEDAKSLSSINLGIQVFDKVLKNIENIDFHYSRNFSENILKITDYNENTALGFSINSKLKKNLLLEINFERVHYDHDFNGDPQNVDILDIGLTYNI